ncbi:MAG: hypothetical protein IMF16_06425 [Proteobacteria bacterium]|nr:hypothetical protein [Pseudomonadota bacterium]
MKARVMRRNETDRVRRKVLRSRWPGVAALIAVLGLMAVCLVPAASSAAVFSVSSSEALASGARMYTSVVDLSGPWKFAVDPGEIGQTDGWQAPDFDDSAWGSLHVPGNWEQQGIVMENPNFPDDRANRGYNGYGWYRRHFTVPADWEQSRVGLRIGQIWDNDWTYINGHLVGATDGPHGDVWDQTREYLIAPHVLRFGEDNVIAIRVLDVEAQGGLAVGPVELVKDLVPAVFEEPGRYAERRGDMVNVGGSVSVPANTRVSGDAVAVGGSVDVRGRVTGQAVAIGGSVRVRPGGTVDGDAVSMGGHVEREGNGMIGGQVIEVGVLPWVGGEGFSGRFDGLRRAADWPPFRHGPFRRLGDLVQNLFVWGFVALVALLIIPKRLNTMARALPADPGRAAVHGVVGGLLTLPALLILVVVAIITCVVLAITVIGLVLIPVVGAAVLLAGFLPGLLAVLGSASVWLGLGRAAAVQIGKPEVSDFWSILLGVAMVAIAVAIPVIGTLVMITVCIFGFGVALMTGLGAGPDWLRQRLDAGRRRAPAAASETPSS